MYGIFRVCGRDCCFVSLTLEMYIDSLIQVPPLTLPYLKSWSGSAAKTIFLCIEFVLATPHILFTVNLVGQ